MTRMIGPIISRIIAIVLSSIPMPPRSRRAMPRCPTPARGRCWRARVVSRCAARGAATQHKPSAMIPRDFIGSPCSGGFHRFVIPRTRVTGISSPRLHYVLLGLARHRGDSEFRPRQEWQSKRLARAVQRVVDIAMDILLAELVVQA